MYQPATSKRLLYTLFISQSLLSASQIAIFTLMTIVATELSGTEAAAGLPSSLRTFTQAFLALPMALLMGRFGRRLGFSIGYGAAALSGLIGIIAILQESFPLLLFSAALLGLGRASGEQTRFAAGEIFPENLRARMIGRIIFAGTIGAVLGPALVEPSGQWMQALGLNPNIGPWAVALLLSGLAALINLLLLRPDPQKIAQAISQMEEDAAPETSRQPARPLRQLLLLPTVQLAILAMLISQLVMVMLMLMTPLHMDHQGQGRAAISLVIAAHTLGMFGLSAVTGYLIDRFGRIPMLLLGAALLILSAILAPLATNELTLAAALFLLGLGWNFGYVAGSALMAGALQGQERAKVQGVNDALIFFAAGLGSLGAGPLFNGGGYVAVSTVGIVFTLLLLAMTYRLTRPQLEISAV